MAGPVWVEDDSIGRALAGLSDSFSGKGGAYIANVRSEIALREEQRRKLQEQMQAAQEQTAAETARLKNMPPPTPAQTAWAKSGGPIGTEVVPAGGVTPLQVLPNASEVPARDAATARAFELERNKQIATAALGAQHATSMSDVAKGSAELAGQAQVGLYGNAPIGSPEWTKTQTQLEGKQPVLEGKNVTGYGVLDADGRLVGRGVTQNFRTDASGTAIQVPPGGTIVKMGEMSAETGPLKDSGARLATIDRGVQKVARKEVIGQPEALEIAQALAQEHKDVVKLEKNDVGTVVPVVVPEHPMAKVYAPLVDHLNAVLGGGRPAPQVSAFDRGAPPVGNVSVPGVTLPTQPPETANIGGTAGVPTTPAPEPAAAAPIIPPPGQVTATPGPPVIQGTGAELQKELFNSQFYRQYSDSMTAYNNVKDAFKSDNPSADLRGIYALAKLYDPGSVVREGELKLTQGASSIAERLAGMYNSLAGKGGRLTPTQRADIMQEAYGAARLQYESMNVKNRDAADRAQRLQIDPRNVMVPLQVPEPPKAEEISAIKRGSKAQPLSRGAGGGKRYDDVDAIVGIGR